MTVPEKAIFPKCLACKTKTPLSDMHILSDPFSDDKHTTHMFCSRECLASWLKTNIVRISHNA